MTVRANVFARLAKYPLLAIAGALCAASAVQGQALPPNPSLTCTVPQATFNNWFTEKNGVHQPSLNGAVDPADSVAFVPNSLCSFYQWSEQMFMWATSPTPVTYGGGSRVFDSLVFYDVTPEDPVTGKRSLVPHNTRFPLLSAMRAAQAGAHNLPVIVDSKGHAFEVITPPKAARGNSLVRTATGSVEISAIKTGENGKAVFLDRAGKPIAAQLAVTAALLPSKLVAPRLSTPAKLPANKRLVKPMLESKTMALARVNNLVNVLNKSPIAEKFIINGKPIFINIATQTPIQMEQGQADGSVLLAHNGSLIYFGIMVNDVYAYYLTGRAHGAIPPSLPTPGQFPTTQADLNAITAFAGKQFPDNNALAIELKTSWVDASTLPDPQNYITAMATVPTYTHTSSTLWTATGGHQTIKVALLGMHVVGSALNHPEMIWATFEHQDNAPRASYNYNATSGPNPHTVNPSAGGTWVLSSSGNPASPNVAHAQVSGANIAGANGFPISPSDTMLMAPWGNQGNDATDNTQVISINENIRSMMGAAGAGADIRNNYIFGGAIWTFNGHPAPTDQTGSLELANSTLETYVQLSLNCFGCHTGNQTDISFVFPVLNPLF